MRLLPRYFNVLLGLGSSLGYRKRNLWKALVHLDADEQTQVVAMSRLYASKPIGVARGLFCNGVVWVRTKHSPLDLLLLCKIIEKKVGRRPSVHWADRMLDIDILLFENRICHSRQLIIPHPYFLQRSFAFLPAVEVAPNFFHPHCRAPLHKIAPPSGEAVWLMGGLPVPMRIFSYLPEI